MVIPFFGKKPAGSDKPESDTRRSGNGDKSDVTTTMDFTQVGDMGRALAAAAGKIQVSESTHEVSAAMEEAAILYANANEGGAKAVLEAAVDGAKGKASESLWQMLFDLYRLMGEREAFESRAVVFAQQYEISPPAWDENTPSAPTAKRDSAPAVNLSGNLGGSAKTQFEQLVRIGAKTGKLRIDLSRVKSIDAGGCDALAEALDALKKQKVKVALLGARHGLQMVEPKLKVGEKEDRCFWLLALALLQQLDEQERFEDVALNYAITFEESPPSWESAEPVNLTESEGHAPKAEEPVVSDAFQMDGVVAGGQPEVLRRLAAYAHERSAVNVDAAELKRLEFVSAGALFNQIAQFQSQGKLTVIRNANALVMALLRVMGIDQVAQLEPKKR